MTTSLQLGFIGLGIMGAPMACNLAQAGHRLHVHTRSHVRAEVAEAATGRDALAAVRADRPDLVVLDLNLPGLGWLELLRRVLLEHPAARVMVLSMRAEALYAARAMQAGAAGYLSKNASPEELLEAVQRVAAGGRYIEAEIAQELAVRLTEHGNAITMNPRLFARISDLYDRRADLGLTEAQSRLLADRYRGAVRAGAALDEAGQAQMREISGRLATLTTDFGQHLLDDTNASAVLFADAAELDGLSAAEIAAAGRAAADAGWIPYQLQIGQTGKVVKPSLYIGVGISGAIQHRVGMQTAEHVVAINKDPDAPVGEFADLFVVGDLFQVVPALTEEIRRRKGA